MSVKIKHRYLANLFPLLMAIPSSQGKLVSPFVVPFPPLLQRQCISQRSARSLPIATTKPLLRQQMSHILITDYESRFNDILNDELLTYIYISSIVRMRNIIEKNPRGSVSKNTGARVPFTPITELAKLCLRHIDTLPYDPRNRD